jgi:hypothetical protein
MPTPSDLHAPTPQTVARYVKKNSARVKKVMADMHHHAPATSIRETDYKGHHIEVRTTYEIKVDGRPIAGHLVVTDEGQVQCHALPNYTFQSALDVVRSLIDVFPDDFEHAGHGGHSMPGTSPRRMGGKTRGARSKTSVKKSRLSRKRK